MNVGRVINRIPRGGGSAVMGIQLLYYPGLGPGAWAQGL